MHRLGHRDTEVAGHVVRRSFDVVHVIEEAVAVLRCVGEGDAVAIQLNELLFGGRMGLLAWPVFGFKEDVREGHERLHVVVGLVRIEVPGGARPDPPSHPPRRTLR